MQYIESILSLLFFLVFFVYMFWGTYIIKLNPKSDVNKMFLAMCISLSIWSFGFAMANSALDIYSALFWRRFSAIGWTSLHSLTLHFIIVLTRKNISLKRWKLTLLHIPAIINMYIFSFSYSLSQLQYNLVKTDLGWTNVSHNNIYDWFFYLYYAIYTIIGLTLLWKWKKRVKNKRINKQVNLIFMAILASLFLGSFTDFIMNSAFTQVLPQMSPIFILFPVWAMYYSAKRYGLIKSENISKDEIILKMEDRQRLFKNIEYSFYVGGILAFISEYLLLESNIRGNLSSAIMKSIILFVMGFSINLSQRLKNDSSKEAFIMTILVLSIPVVSFHFLEYGSITIWVLPIIIILSSLVFNKKTLLVSTTIVAVITQRIVWILEPEVFVNINSIDYISRIGMFILAYFVASHVNNAFISKVKENAYQIHFQKMNSELSFNFVNINQKNFSEKVDNLLAQIGVFFQVDRSYLFLIDDKNNSMTYTNEWCNININPEVGTIEDIPLSTFPWWIEQLEKRDLVYIEDVKDMPIEAITEQKQLLRQKVKSLISVPVKSDDKIQGFIGLDSVKAYKIWSKEHIKLLNILSNLIANGLMHINYDKEIEFMAYYDSLTKLPNRFLFSDRVNQAINHAKRNEEFVVVIFIDLDDFKSVNDTMGHTGGDLLLQYIGESLSKNLRNTDTVARFGGDEFMIMLKGIKDIEHVEMVTKKLMNIFTNSFNIYGQDFFVTGSAGVAIYPIDGDTSEELVKNADTAMYKAKAKGKNQYALCNAHMKKEAKLNMILSNDLYRALEREEFQVYYQPQIDLHTGRVSGIEALIRWIHPQRGIISPGVFIPLAEKNSLINSIGEWVLKTACMQNKKWQDMGLPHVKIGVNLSAVQFVNPNITERIEGILKETGLNPKYLELEITESIAIREATSALNTLNKLKKIGVSIAIDDFGTEYSSLSRLKTLPIDRIKIDMQFVQGIEKDKKDRAITMVIISLAKSLGLNVLAEGVETSPQLDFLNKKMCDYVQGYYYYRPMPANEMEEILKSIDETDLNVLPEFSY